MQSEGLPPDTITFTSAIGACAKSGDYGQALSLLEMMRSAELQPNTITYSNVISACERAGEWRGALRLLQQMQEEGVGVDLMVINAAIGACARAGEWERAVSLLEEEMKSQGIAPDVISHNGVLTALAKARPAAEWQRALAYVEEMPSRGATPDLVSYNVVLSALGRAGEWERALELLQRMRRGEVRVEPSGGDLDVDETVDDEFDEFNVEEGDDDLGDDDD
eukprot:6193696-Pleurochrysis_carterae.AAC.3